MKKREYKNTNPCELSDSSISEVSGGTVDFHVFEDGSAGWVASAAPGDIFQSSKNAIAVDKASGGSGISASQENLKSNFNPYSSNNDLAAVKDQWNNPLSRY